MASRVYRNLVPDSPLHRALENLLRKNGGVASVQEICRQVFLLPSATATLARALVEELVEQDPRLCFDGDFSVVWSEPGAEEIWQRRKHFLIVDVETTDGALQSEPAGRSLGAKPSDRGFRPRPSGRTRRDQRIIELGVCHFEGGRITDEWSQLLNPDRPLSPWIRKMTGIGDEMLAAAPRFAEVADRLLDELEDAIVVAHHARFDVAILSSEISRLRGERLANRYLCTVELARHFLPGMENYRLATLGRALGLAHKRPHRAGSDARATAELFARLSETAGDALAAHLRPRPPAEQKAAEIVETQSG